MALETIIRLENSEEDALSAFFEKININLAQIKRTKLSEDLKNFIKQKGKVNSRDIQYLVPLLDLITIYKTIEIISTNYDIVMEQFCNAHKLILEDGFNGTFNKKRFISENSQVRLYKIHGSILWYRSTSGKFYKTTIDSTEKVKTVFGEDLEPLILYPIRKWEYVEPLFELISDAKEVMLSEDSKYVIVIGYSFRDDHIRDMFFDIFRDRNDIYCFLIDPDAYQIYENKIKYYNYENKILSSMAGRVICIPAVVDNELKSIYSKKIEPMIWTIEEIERQRKITATGHDAQRDNIILSLARLNYIDKLEEILESINISSLKLGFWEKVEVGLILIGNEMLNGSKDRVYHKVLFLLDIINSMLIWGLDLRESGGKYVVDFKKEISDHFMNHIFNWGLDNSEDGFGPIWYSLCDKYKILERDDGKDNWRYKVSVKMYELDLKLGSAFKAFTAKKDGNLPAREPKEIIKSIKSVVRFNIPGENEDMEIILRDVIRICVDLIMGDFDKNIRKILGHNIRERYIYGKYFYSYRQALDTTL